MRIKGGVLACAILVEALAANGQGVVNLSELQKAPVVSGYEQSLTAEIAHRLASLGPKTDELGNVWVTVGSGSPQRLIVAPVDEPGYVVSEITEDGYMRVQRLPQAAPNAVFDALNFAQPVVVMTRGGKEVPGVFAGLSVHLQPGRLNAPKMNHVEEMYVDIGAKSAEEVKAAGVDVLDPVAAGQRSMAVGNEAQGGPGAGEEAGCEALLQLLGRMRESKATGTTVVAFVTQQWLGGRGLNRLLTEVHPDEMIFVGRVVARADAEKKTEVEGLKPGDGVVLGIPGESKEASEQLAGRLLELATKEQIPVHPVAAALPRIAGYAKSAALPEKFVELGVPTLWPVTPAETIAVEDTGRVERLLEGYLEIARPQGGIGGGVGGGDGGQTRLQALAQVYGASGHEGAVRERVKNMLPEWAREKTKTDAAGNLVLHVGEEKKDGKTSRIVFVAHMDEIGYEVKKVEEDGRLEVSVLGGGYPQYFLGHVALVHKQDGTSVGGVMELPSGWDKAGFEFTDWIKSLDEPAHVYVGTRSKQETEKLGIALGDFVTIPKEYRQLFGTRASARSMDDRVGCAALIAAVNQLGPNLPGRDVTFVWSTEEELGLKGAAAFAEESAKEGRAPDFVFAIDTFVSSDSPLESKRFADAELGKGFVVRAVDNSNIVPRQYVERVVELAKENGIAAQYGVTGGGNDGSVFTRYGSVDVALGWPMRYAHSPGEVIDVKDLDALGKIVEVIARKW